MRFTSDSSVSTWGRLLLLLALVLNLATPGAARPKPVPHHGRIYIPKMLPTVIPDARKGFQTVLRGHVSWYGKFFQGMETASGELYDRFQYTCAHKTLPFGTRLRVTNVENGVTVVVKVTDRGPYRKERIIDLSEVAARPLGLIESGSATVIAVIVPPTTPLGLVDTPTDLAVLQAADPRPRAPFTAYLLPLLNRATRLMAAVQPAASVAPAGPTVAAATATTGYSLQVGTFANPLLAATQLARVHAVDPDLSGSLVSVVVDGKPVSQVVISQLSSWLAAETVRRNLQLWGITGQIRALQPTPDTPDPAATADAALVSSN